MCLSIPHNVFLVARCRREGHHTHAHITWHVIHVMNKTTTAVDLAPLDLAEEAHGSFDHIDLVGWWVALCADISLLVYCETEGR